MTERKLPNPRDDLDDRLLRFRDEQDVASGRPTTDKSRQNGVGFAMRIGVEIVAALIVGVGLGLLFDRWIGVACQLLCIFTPGSLTQVSLVWGSLPQRAFAII